MVCECLEEGIDVAEDGRRSGTGKGMVFEEEKARESQVTPLPHTSLLADVSAMVQASTHVSTPIHIS